MNFKNIRVVGFDADDTLWVNEPIFQDVVSRLIDMLSNHTNPGATFPKETRPSLREARNFS